MKAMKEQVIRVIDTDEQAVLPIRFRMVPQAVPTRAHKLVGGVSGSGQFTASGLQVLHQTVGGGNLTIVDLRQECHGFADDTAISWRDAANAANRGLNDEEIERKEQVLISKEQQSAPDKRMRSERQLTQELGIGYVRFAVTDHHRPSDETIDRFIRFVRTLSPDMWLHVHCLGGSGRTTTFLIMIEMLRYAGTQSREQIIWRHKRIGGRDMYAIDAGQPQLYRSAIERIEFLHRFYEYCIDLRDHDQPMLWSEWLATHKSVLHRH